ncbi:MAG: HAD-IIIA family hydrolase [Calditrichaeota bacterium]|nr:HAD-IIIA family hydrolase [Calditrichota bacterium]
MGFDLLIFDLDGTLVDTARDVHFCVNKARADFNLPPLTLEEARKSIGPGPNTFVDLVLPPDQKHRLDEFIKKFRACYIDHLTDHSRPYPGVVELLHHLQMRQIPLVVATNKPRRYTEKLLRDLDLRKFFSGIFTPDDVTSRKPDPEMIVKILEEMRTRAGDALLIGDTDNDILAGKGAGVWTCAVTYGYGPEEVLQNLEPDFVIDQPKEILEILSTKKQAFVH